jgi:hypothetical protein
MHTFLPFRHGLGRYAAVALAGAAALGVLGAAGPAYAAPASGVAVTPITLTADWSGNAQYGSGSPGWFVDTSLVDPAVVHLQGAVTQVSTTAAPDPNLIGTLPPAARPDRSVYELVHTFDGTYADIEIDQFGDIYLINPHSPAVQDYRFVSLEGVSYERSISASNVPVPVNTPEWSANAGLDSVAPSGWVDGSGNVHLAGAATQLCSTNLCGEVIATLPPELRPNATVYVMAHTYDGTYTQLVIEPSNGEIAIVGTHYPAAVDYRFLSLEGITFSQSGSDSSPVAVNTANYADTPGVYHPSADLDAWGVVHLYGAVYEHAAGGDPDLVGTVPAFARPGRYVYELVSTELGTYADVVITPAGQINLIAPRSPLLTAFGLVSLEGISYQP